MSKILIVNCSFCSKEVNRYPSQLKRQAFCSKKCTDLSRKLLRYVMKPGMIFNRLVAIKPADKNYSTKPCYWIFKCECGNKITARTYHVMNSKIKSCGCYKQDNPSHYSHGFADTRFYGIWAHITQRCTNPNVINWENYGGRGIANEWESFEDFKHDMYASYLDHCRLHGEENTSIDRIDNDDNYRKSNCRWATYQIQAFNKRTTKNFQFVN